MRRVGARFAAIGLAGATVLIVAALAGCGSGSGSTSAGDAPPRLGPACRGSELAIKAERHSSIGAGGTIYTRLHVANHSRRPCTVAGVPKVVALDRHGRPIGVGEPMPLERLGKGGRLRVRLDAGGSASFRVVHYDGIGAGACRQASVRRLRVTIPGSGPTRVVRVSMGYCPKPGAGLRLRVWRIE